MSLSKKVFKKTQNKIKKFYFFLFLEEVSFSKAEEMILQDGEKYLVVFDVFGGFFKYKKNNILKKNIFNKKKIYISFYDFISFYSKEEFLHISKDHLDIFCYDFDLVYQIIDLNRVEKIVISVEGRVEKKALSKIYKKYPKLTIKSNNFFIENFIKDMPLARYISVNGSMVISPRVNKKNIVDKKITSLISGRGELENPVAFGRPDVHKLWVIKKLFLLPEKDCMFTRYLNYYGDLKKWNNLLTSLINNNEKIDEINLGNFFIKDEKVFSFIQRGYVSLVVESIFFTPLSFFTEKTIWPIYSFRPFILAAPAYTLDYMKEIGFKTFNKWWDESYDNEEDHYIRMKKVFSLIDEIMNKSYEELDIMLKEMKPVLIHNFKCLVNFEELNKKYYLKQQ